MRDHTYIDTLIFLILSQIYFKLFLKSICIMQHILFIIKNLHRMQGNSTHTCFLYSKMKDISDE